MRMGQMVSGSNSVPLNLDCGQREFEPSMNSALVFW